MEMNSYPDCDKSGAVRIDVLLLLLFECVMNVVCAEVANALWEREREGGASRVQARQVLGSTCRCHMKAGLRNHLWNSSRKCYYLSKATIAWCPPVNRENRVSDFEPLHTARTTKQISVREWPYMPTRLSDQHIYEVCPITRGLH